MTKWQCFHPTLAVNFSFASVTKYKNNSDNDPVNLRLFEAFYIRKNKPTLNPREECMEFADLLF